jgi:Flp pilus assembly protein TadG
MRNLIKNDRGAAIIELALIAPVFALMTIGVIDLANAYNRKLTLEQAAQRAIEKIQQTTQDQEVADALKIEAVCQVNGSEIDKETGAEVCKAGLLTTADVTVEDRLECIDADGAIAETRTGDAAEGACTNAAQVATRYKSVEVTNVYEPMFPIHFSGYDGADDVKGYPITATAGMRTQ